MEYGIIGIASFVTAGLTLFSGFGLGTLLMPVFAIFFEVNIAIALTAIVHFLNNLFKLTLLGRHADKKAVLQFGLPALLSAFVGAWLLLWLSHQTPLQRYTLWGHELQITSLNLIIAGLMILFVIYDLSPRMAKISFGEKALPIGGILSGFLGGLSGHQGALRAAFLLRLGLSKESFIGTGVVIACLVDLSRISVYSSQLLLKNMNSHTPLLLTAATSAFLGSYLGNRLLKKVTLRGIQITVSSMLFLIAMGLALGWI
ncbi:MAG: sulfite exporter TauE/SafE family protein [Deltaproteobacteria bacterium]|nr:sulfite exporter TauE/SafE family protein [Deltaproteobacteria bacterium]